MFDLKAAFPFFQELRECIYIYDICIIVLYIMLYQLYHILLYHIISYYIISYYITLYHNVSHLMYYIMCNNTKYIELSLLTGARDLCSIHPSPGMMTTALKTILFHVRISSCRPWTMETRAWSSSCASANSSVVFFRQLQQFRSLKRAPLCAAGTWKCQENVAKHV